MNPAAYLAYSLAQLCQSGKQPTYQLPSEYACITSHPNQAPIHRSYQQLYDVKDLHELILRYIMNKAPG